MVLSRSLLSRLNAGQLEDFVTTHLLPVYALIEPSKNPLPKQPLKPLHS
jgi:hypothetical protein